MKPTEVQVKEFWEKFGFGKDSIGNITFPDSTENMPIYGGADYPSIDLNNLFKYAVPKLDHPNILLYYDGNVKEWFCKLTIAQHPWEIGEFGENPALALFWAIQEVIKDSSK